MMLESGLLKRINEGKVVFIDRGINARDLPWNEHPSFRGVYLKHLVKGEDTEGRFSCHIVKIGKGFEIGEHIHEGKWELHEVIEGSGKCILVDKEVKYQPGVSAVIPAGLVHRVVAPENDLYLLAKFVPALL